MFVNENFCSGEDLVTHKIDNDLKTILIKNTKVFLPYAVNTSMLPWLYHEIFDKWNENPSSYDHPNLVKVDDYSWIIDAGAFEGFFSLKSLNETNAFILAIEPLPIMRAPLYRTLHNVAPDSRFDIVELALGSKKGYADFNLTDEISPDSSIIDSHSHSSNDIIQVEVDTIDNIILDSKLSGRGMIKMDIEGAEMEALKGAKEVLSTLKPKLAIAVYHNFENAILCADIIREYNPDYTIEFRGYYGYFSPPRPYMLFAY